MIIFDLDGTLANCEHRRHFVDPVKNGCIQFVNTQTGCCRWGFGYKDEVFQEFKPNWSAFYEACDKDEPIYPALELLETLITHDEYGQLPLTEVEIWSGRCSSVKKKTMNWLKKYIINLNIIKLKMRPKGNNTPDDELKEQWLYESLREGKQIEFVLDGCPKVIKMWRRRGIFVFNCAQHDEEF